MNKNIITTAITVILSIMILLGAGIIGFVLFSDGEGDIIDVELSDGESDVITFRKLGIVPGTSTTYTVLLTGEVKGEHTVTVSFSENEEHTLKNYVYVKIESDGEVLCDKLLADVFAEGTELTFKRELSDIVASKVTVTYYMPSEVGNEAESTEVDFDLIITATNAAEDKSEK